MAAIYAKRTRPASDAEAVKTATAAARAATAAAATASGHVMSLARSSSGANKQGVKIMQDLSGVDRTLL